MRIQMPTTRFWGVALLGAVLLTLTAAPAISLSETGEPVRGLSCGSGSDNAH